jgi:hypothetical protein
MPDLRVRAVPTAKQVIIADDRKHLNVDYAWNFTMSPANPLADW